MANVTYLLGAGASARCLPIYKNFKDRFSQFIFFLESMRQNIGIDYIEPLEEISKSLMAIQQELRYHSTPDTIAKKYFHKGLSELLTELKNCLILFFLYEQYVDKFEFTNDGDVVKETIDSRYDAFISALLKPISNKVEFRDNIHIISWNYDIQFEI